MRISRKAVAVVAAGLLASPVVASSVSAQSNNNMKAIAVTTNFVGPLPTGMTGLNATLDCQNLTGSIGNQQLTGTFGTAGGTTTLNFGLNSPVFTATNPAVPTVGTTTNGSSCRVIASTQGAGRNFGTISISVGGTARTTTNSVTPATTTAAAFNTGSTDFIPMFIDTNVVITVTYPQITVKKVVNGDEPVAGFSYPMSIACNSGNVGGFIDGLLGIDPVATNKIQWASGTATPGTAPLSYTATSATDVTNTNTLDGTRSIPDGSLVLPGGAGWYITIAAYDAAVAGDFQQLRVYDYRTTAATVTTANAVLAVTDPKVFAVLGSSAYISTLGVSAVAATFPLVPTPALGSVVSAAAAVNGNGTILAFATGFDGKFTLKGGASRVFGNNEFPGFSSASQCEVVETNAQGGVTMYNGTGVQAGTTWKSLLTTAGNDITVSNSFYGDLVISKVVTGDSKSNISTFEISVACDKGGPKDTFLLKDRQSKVYNNIAAGTNCLVTETKSDGAVASYADNVGDNTTDGRVTIKLRGTGCAQPGAPTNPASVAPVTSFNECWANVIITNDYNPPATTEAPATSAPATAAPATAAPAVTPAPATPVEATATFTG